MLRLSQVIYGVRDLDAATKQIEALGLTVIDGGLHPGLGTANRIVPLGDAYFEILGVINEAEAARNPYGLSLLQHTEHGNRLVRWSLRTDNIAETARQRSLVPESRKRQRPDGTLLTWQAAGLALSLAEGWLPFFMQWDDPNQYPGSIPVKHKAQPLSVAWLELTPKDIRWLKRWLGDAEPPLRIIDGTPGLHRVALRTTRGILLLP